MTSLPPPRVVRVPAAAKAAEEAYHSRYVDETKTNDEKVVGDYTRGARFQFAERDENEDATPTFDDAPPKIIASDTTWRKLDERQYKSMMRKYAPAPGGGRKPAAHAALNPTRLGHDEHLPPAVPDRVDRCFKRPAWTPASRYDLDPGGTTFGKRTEAQKYKDARLAKSAYVPATVTPASNPCLITWGKGQIWGKSPKVLAAEAAVKAEKERRRKLRRQKMLDDMKPKWIPVHGAARGLIDRTPLEQLRDGPGGDQKWLMRSGKSPYADETIDQPKMRF